jgi:hypothetical protein
MKVKVKGERYFESYVLWRCDEIPVPGAVGGLGVHGVVW